MKYMIVILLVIASSTFTSFAQDEEACTLTNIPETNLFVGEGDCDFTEVFEDGFEVEVNGQILTGVITSFRPAEVGERVEEPTPVFESGQQVFVSIASDVYNCRENATIESDVIAEFENQTPLIITGEGTWNARESIMWYPVRAGEETCWVAESDPSGNPVWLVSARQDITEIIDFEIGDVVIVQGDHNDPNVDETIILCREDVDGEVQHRLHEDTWMTVISAPREVGGFDRYEVQIGYTDNTCWVANGTNAENNDLPWLGPIYED